MKYNNDYTDTCMRYAMQSEVAISHFFQSKLTYRTEKGAVVLPLKKVSGEKYVGGVVSSNGEFISNTGFHKGKEGVYSIDSALLRREDKPTIYLGYFNSVWGHCLTDDMKLLWFVLTSDYKAIIDTGGYQLAYLCDKDFKLGKSMAQMLSAIGLHPQDFVRVDEPTVFSTLIIPQGCFIADEKLRRYYSKEYKEIIDKIIVHLVIKDNRYSDNRYEKIYLSRTHLSQRLRDNGEKSIENMFRKMGYTVIYPETLTLEEQITLYQRCNTMATTEGSVSHNAIFLKEGANLVIIRKVPFINQYQLAINELRNLNVTYIDANLSVFVDSEAPAAGPFFMYINDNMSRFSQGLVNDNFSLSLFRRYANTALLLPHFERRIKVPSYYYSKLSEEIEAKKNKWRRLLSNLPISDDLKDKLKMLGKKLLR